MNESNSERERIKRRVAKLLNMTLDNGASEAGAMIAAKRAAELMAHYDIEASELSLRDTTSITRTVIVHKYGNVPIGWSAGYHVARLCDCMSWYTTAEGRGSNPTFTFFGMPADAEIAAYLFDLISNGILAEIDIYKASSAYRTANIAGAHGRSLVHSFIAGMQDRICARLDALRNEKQQTIYETTWRSLVILKEELINKDLKTTGIKLVTISRSGPVSHSNDAYNRGNMAGERLPLSPGVVAERVAGMLR